MKAFIILINNFLFATTYFVSPDGDNNNPGTEEFPWATIQHAANVLSPGDSVLVKSGVYNEKIEINVSGTDGQYITFKNYDEDTVIIDGSGISNQHMVYMDGKDYIRIIGFHIRNNVDGSGIFIENGGDFIELKNNTIYNMMGQHGMGITVYAHSADSVTHLIIDGNKIYDCEPATSEALVVNGSVFDFEIINNIVHDVNNIGIDVIGGEVPGKVAKRGIVRGNFVYHARSNYGGGYAAGIYVDGGTDITVERNTVYESDMGIEIGCENAGYTAERCTIRANLLYQNDKAGLVFGGYDAGVGRVKNCAFLNNTLYKNQVLEDGEGELWIQYAEDNIIENNIIYAGAQGILLSSWAGNINNILNYNCWVPSSEPHPEMFIWNGTAYNTFDAYRSATGQDQQSIKTDPKFIDTTSFDFHLEEESPCIDVGDPDTPPNYDFDGNPTPQDGNYDGDSIVDIGAFEFMPSVELSENNQKIDPPEFTINPNPASDIIFINFPEMANRKTEVCIYDITGRLVTTLNNSHYGKEPIIWEPKAVPEGVYFIQLITGNQVLTKKVLVIR